MKARVTVVMRQNLNLAPKHKSCSVPFHCDLYGVGLIEDTTVLSPQCLNSLRLSDAYMRQWNNHHWLRYWLVAWSAPSHYLNHCWYIANLTLRNKLWWNFNRNLYIFIPEFKNVVWKMAAIMSRPRCVNSGVTCHYLEKILGVAPVYCNEIIVIASKTLIGLFQC